MAKRQKLSISREWPTVAAAAQLPNVVGATIQDTDLQVGDTCYVSGTSASYTCTTATAGAGVWVLSSLITNGVSNAMLRQSGALSVIGRSANSTGNVADITATAATDAVFRESGSVIGFGTVATGGIANNAVTNGKIRQSSGLSILGRSANSTGDIADITATAATDAVFRESGSAVGFGTIATGGIANNAVTNGKIRQSSGLSILGRSANSTGDIADITAGADADFLRRSGTTVGFGTHPAVEQLKLGVPASTTQTIASGTSATISAAVRTVLLATGSGNFSLTMRALNDGDEILLVKTSTDANSITLVRAGSETINGVAGNLLIVGSTSTLGYIAFTIRVVSATAVVVL